MLVAVRVLPCAPAAPFPTLPLLMPPPATLLFPSRAAMTALSKQPKYRWVVYDAPPTAPPPLADPRAAPGWLGSLTACAPFNPTLEFLDR